MVYVRDSGHCLDTVVQVHGTQHLAGDGVVYGTRDKCMRIWTLGSGIVLMRWCLWAYVSEYWTLVAVPCVVPVGVAFPALVIVSAPVWQGAGEDGNGSEYHFHPPPACVPRFDARVP